VRGRSCHWWFTGSVAPHYTPWVGTTTWKELTEKIDTGLANVKKTGIVLPDIGKERSVRYIASMRIRSFLQRYLVPWYFLRALAGPFLFSLFCLMFLFLLHFVMRYIDQLVGKGLGAWVIMELISLNLAWMVVLAVPMSVLVATLMAFGELSQANEITAMKASGMSNFRLLRPVLLAATVVAILLMLFNNRILPEANHQAKVLTMDIRKKKPTLNIVAGSFSQDLPGYSILVRKTYPHNNDLEGITIYDYTRPNAANVITAERGRVSFSPDFRKLLFYLEDGEIHQLNLQDMEGYRKIRFTSHRIAMAVEGFDFERSESGAFTRSDRELSAMAMLTIVDSLRVVRQKREQKILARIREDIDARLSGKADSAVVASQRIPGRTPPALAARTRTISSTIQNEISQNDFTGKQINQYLVEIHKKYSIPAACIVFVLVGLPLGTMVRKGGFGVAASLSLGFFILYWSCLIGGEKMADRGIFSPLWGMWAANIIIGTFGVFLLARTSREMVSLNLGALARFLPSAWRGQQEPS